MNSRKITWTLSIAHALSSTGFLASATVTSIVGADLSGRTEWAGVPSAVYLLGAAAASLALGYVMDMLGRRKALAIAYAIGAAGAAIAAWSIVARTFPGFLCGLALMGPGNAAAGLSRFVAAEVHPPRERGRAIAIVVVGGTAGTLIWPLLSVSLGPWLAQPEYQRPRLAVWHQHDVAGAGSTGSHRVSAAGSARHRPCAR